MGRLLAYGIFPDQLSKTYILAAAKSFGPLPENPQGVSQLAWQIQALAHPQAVTLPPLPAIAERISGSKHILENNPLNLEV